MNLSNAGSQKFIAEPLKPHSSQIIFADFFDAFARVIL